MKVYLEYNGVEYNDYDFYLDGYKGDDVIVIQGKCVDNYIQNGLTSGFVPQKGMKVYVVPGCPRAIADIRKDYIIKRKPEDADFIVSSVRRNQYFTWYNIDELLVIPSLNAVFGKERYGYNSYNSIDAFVSSVYPSYDRRYDSSAVYINYPDTESFFAYKLEKLINTLNTATGVQTKPIIDYKSLPTFTANQLEFDTLEMIYRLGIGERGENNENNLLVQLQALNQTDWRDYAGTIHLLYRMMIQKNHYGCAAEKFSRMSVLPKAIKELCQTMARGSNYVSQDDLDMGRRLLEKITGFNFQEQQFWNMQKIRSRLRECGIQDSCFYDLYDNIVKIRPKCIN